VGLGNLEGLSKNFDTAIIGMIGRLGDKNAVLNIV
jgi:hypothetical protein